MIKYSLAFLLICLSLVCSFAQTNEELQLVEKEKLRFSTLKNVQERGGISQTNYDVHYYSIDINVDPAVKSISGNVGIFFTTTEELINLTIDISSVLKVDSVLFENQKVSFASAGKDQTQITLSRSLTKDSKAAIYVFYKGVPPVNGFNAFDQRTHAGAPIIWSFSCPDNADDWLPCKNTLYDKADSVRISITHPSQYSAIANGKLVEKVASSGKTKTTWLHKYPITTYLIAFAVTNYSAYSDYVVNGTDSLEILNYVYPENLTTAKSSSPSVIPVFKWYEEKFGPYPFRKERYGQAQFSWGGGMEHQTTSFVTDFSRGLLAHELAHQWFGDMVTCASFTEAWLNEGFATYVTALYDETPSPATFKSWRQSTINAITGSVGGSVYCTDTTNANRIYDYRLTYQKGAMLLHMIRWKTGDSAFYAGIRNYLNDPDLRFKYATTSDLQKHFEKSSGQSFQTFFDKWFRGQGYPKYELRWNQTAEGKVDWKLLQTTSHNSVSFYDMPVEIRFSGLLNGVAKDTTFTIQHFISGQTGSFISDIKLTGAVIDPNLWLVSRKTVVKDATLDVNELEVPDVKLQPNPAFDVLKVTATSPIELIQVYDVNGKKLMENSYNQSETELNVKHLSNGRYYLLLKLGENYKTLTFLKM